MVVKKIIYLTLISLLIFCRSRNFQQKNNKNSSLKNIVFFGNSLTEGLGLPAGKFAFPALIQQNIIQNQLPFKIYNLGLSGDTTSSAMKRLDEVLKYDISIFVLELGANDYMKGVPSKRVKKNLSFMIEQVQKKNPTVKILLAGLKAFPQFSLNTPSKIENYEQVYKDLQKKYNLTLYPFILKDVAGIPSLNQKDGLHPNIKGHQVIANNLWIYLEPMLLQPTK